MILVAEIEQRILSELEEAGEEDIPTLINTVTDRTGKPIELEQVRGALENLVRAGLVRLASDRDVSRRWIKLSQASSLALLVELTSRLKFRVGDGHWMNVPIAEAPLALWQPAVVNTDEGYRRGREILEKRGYQWWRPRK